jgi:hypothetical protein
VGDTGFDPDTALQQLLYRVNYRSQILATKEPKVPSAPGWRSKLTATVTWINTAMAVPRP